MNKLKNTLQGFKTIIFNIVAIVSTWLATEHGIELPEEHQGAVATTIVAVANIALRFITKTPVGKPDNKPDNKPDDKTPAKISKKDEAI